MKRIFSLVLAIAFSFVLAVPSFIVPASAIGPSDAFIASALISFIGSTGIQMWRANLDDYPDPTNIVINDLKSLWHYYERDASNPLTGETVPTWQEAAGIAEQGLTVNNGSFILSYDLAQTYQGFVDWMVQHYNFKPNQEYALIHQETTQEGALYFTLPASEREGLTYLNQGVWALPVATTLSATTSHDGQNYANISAFDCFIIPIKSGNTVCMYGCSLENTGYILSERISNGVQTIYNVNQLSTLNGVSRPNDGTRFKFYKNSTLNISDYYSINAQLNQPSNGLTSSAELAYIVLAGDVVGTSSDLFASVGNIVANRVYDLIAPIIDQESGEVVTPGQSLAIDIGAGTEAGADELVSDVMEAIAEGGLKSNAIPEVISGSLELYPAAQDITLEVGENILSFGDLGRALTTRFPFCIPWDLAYLVESFRVPEKPINVRIDIIPDSWKQRWNITGDTSFPMDLTGPEWYLFRQMMAWALIIGVIGELALLTRNFVNNLST